MNDSRLGVWRLAGAGAVTLTVLFVLCWLAALTTLPIAHMWIQLFTRAPVSSLAALGEGVLWSVVFGGVSGAILACAYNALGRRPA
ncbi:MAG TPA: hypothetical protein VF122_02360 [Caulobacteraceae bacterium]